MNIIPKPEGVKWTDDQWKAIVANGKDILVAAAAGSGKTAVLVERIIRKLLDEENPIDVDRLLIVTFTNAAAKEMKSRIGEAIEKKLEEEPSSSFLRKQLLLLNKASISTLHSFCLDVIRKHYYLINLDPNFRIGNESEIQLLIEEVMEELLEEEYGSEAPERFFTFVDSYTSDRSDTAIQQMILKLFYDSRAQANGDNWLDTLISLYDSDGKSIEESVYFRLLLSHVQIDLKGIQAKLHRAYKLSTTPLASPKRSVTLEEDLTMISQFISVQENWGLLYKKINSLSFGKLTTVAKKDLLDIALDEQIKGLRDEAKKELGKIKDTYFSRSPEQYARDFEKVKPLVETLVSLVKKFEQRFSEAKRGKGLVDFSDLELYCLKILQENEAVSNQYRDKFVEVMVDEYQDTNDVQESILTCVTRSGEEGNLFMVGDVKQAIYGFRLAEPRLFLEKYKAFSEDGKGIGLRIDLNQNFRSRQEVLGGTNFIFKQIMDEEVGEISYDEAAELKLGNRDYPLSPDIEPELILLSKKEVEQEVQDEVEQDIQELETSQLEARWIAQKVKGLVEEKFLIYDKEIKCTRPIKYSDCVILLRSMPWASQMMEEFKNLGVPLYAELNNGYLDTIEIRIMMSLLRIIDNPHQDIPLASILRSPIVGITDNELALIRSHNKKGNYYDSIRTYVASHKDELKEKLESFINLLDKWRIDVKGQTLSSFIWILYRETGYYQFVGGLNGARQRQANLQAFYERARQFEQTSTRGLYSFLRFIERLEERGDDFAVAKVLNEQDNVVRLMTIHKSKGLEFPVVFVAGLNRQFNRQDLNATYLLHREYGFGTKYINPELRLTYPTIAYHAVKNVKKAELLAEEMRVLYVALTRAKEKLYLVGTVGEATKVLDKWKGSGVGSEWLLPDYVRRKAKSYLEWIGPSLLRHAHAIQLIDEVDVPQEIAEHLSRFKMQLVFANEGQDQTEEEERRNEYLDKVSKRERVFPITKEEQEIVSKFQWEYPYQAATVSKAKQSVTELKRLTMQQQEEWIDHKTVQTKTLKRPKFIGNQGLTAPERGTAIHVVMQHLDLRKTYSHHDVEELLASLVNRELLTEEECGVIPVAEIVQFSQSVLGDRIRKAERIHKELQFTFMIKGDSIDKQLDDEQIFVQGIMDCVLEEDDSFVLVDYKTDSMFSLKHLSQEEREQQLAQRYETQLKFYKMALEKIVQKPVQACILYFFEGNQIIDVTIEL